MIEIQFLQSSDSKLLMFYFNEIDKLIITIDEVINCIYNGIKPNILFRNLPIGKQLNKSVKVFHNFTEYRLLHSS